MLVSVGGTMRRGTDIIDREKRENVDEIHRIDEISHLNSTISYPCTYISWKSVSRK